MKQIEKLDLILRELYKVKHDGHVYSMKEICEEQHLPIEPHNEVRTLAHRLQDDGYIRATFTFDDCLAEITSYGIEYCEEDSYTYKQHAIITNSYNVSITNSPNTNIVSNSSNVNIQITNYGEIKTTIERIKETVNKNSSIDSNQKKEILECVEEIETSIEAGKKPKFSYAALAHIAGSISEVGILVVELGKLIFGVH